MVTNLNIGFDAKRYYFNKTGLGNYSRRVVHDLARYHPEHQYFLIAKHAALSDEKQAEWEVINPVSLPFPSFWNRFWSMRRIWNKYKLDVYHGLSNEIPWRMKGKTSVLVTIHDLLFYEFKEDYPWIDRIIYDFKFSQAVHDADHVIAISRATKSDIIRKFGVDPEKITILYQDCHPIFYKQFSSSEKEEVRLKNNLPQNFILCVGSLVGRKNHERLIRAFSSASSADKYKLVLVGGGKQKGKLERLISAQGLQEKVLFRSIKGHADLAKVYQLASASIYPSLKEGFGIPVLESLASKTPVATSGLGSMREAGGRHAYFFDPENIESMTSTIDHMMDKLVIPNVTELEEHLAIFKSKNNMDELIRIYKFLRQG